MSLAKIGEKKPGLGLIQVFIFVVVLVKNLVLVLLLNIAEILRYVVWKKIELDQNLVVKIEKTTTA